MVKMDKDSLLSIVIEKNKRIEDLERLVEEQRRLRFQDASQVEEKAAKIKEWVANKLKELENQNKLLRDQNKKQKEIINILTNQLDIAKSNQLKLSQIINTKSNDKDSNNNYNQAIENNNSHSYSRDNESPIYDSVNIEQSQINHKKPQNIIIKTTNNSSIINVEQQPPPPPLHQSDKWESQLYSLVDETLSSLIKQQSLDEDDNSSNSRKSSLSSMNDLILLVKPSFTTIDGDHVVDTAIDYPDTDCLVSNNSNIIKCNNNNNNQEKLNQTSQNIQNTIFATPRRVIGRKDSINSCDNNSTYNDNQQLKITTSSNLFDSPLRSRSGKDSMLRTQSVRRNPAPGKLYDFILADLVKRGFLIKPGALKNHQRWFVLKNFHLYSYKNESEETLKVTPGVKIRLDYNCQIQSLNSNQSNNESNFPFKITYLDKSLQLIAPSAQIRDEWIRILTVTINMSDIEPDTLTKNNSTHEGLLTATTHGHSKRYHATLINHILFFLKSMTDPTPMSYVSIKGAKIREITDSHDYDEDERQEMLKTNSLHDCSLAIYPRYSMKLDPVYITLGSQQDTDKWLFTLSTASGLDQSHGTQFERALTKIMINNSMNISSNSRNGDNNHSSLDSSSGSVNCLWKEHSLMLYSDKPISQPLTSLPNETLQVEATELFKSMLLFIQVPLEPVAIDYHVSLLKNCLSRFLAHPELRNEFYAQLIKQSTWILHKCNIPKLSFMTNDSDSSPSLNAYDQNYSPSSDSRSSLGECQFLTDIRVLETISNNKESRKSVCPTVHSTGKNSIKDKSLDSNQAEEEAFSGPPPSQSELVQVMQIFAVVVSLHLPKGRMRWWLVDHLRRFADVETSIGKYALYTLRAIDRNIMNGPRDNVPSRTEIMSIILRNPYDHSNPHSLPVNLYDGTYLVVSADGSTTVEEFMTSMSKQINIRNSFLSDFYLFADDPSGNNDLHILEPKRKVLDILGWWEEQFRKNNLGRYQNTKSIKLLCKKRLVFRAEPNETSQERALIVHQVNQEIFSSKRIQLNENLALELASIMAQYTYGDYIKNDKSILRQKLDKTLSSLMTNKSNQSPDNFNSSNGNHSIEEETYHQLIDRWQHLSGKSDQDCTRVYLNCIRRLNLDL